MLVISRKRGERLMIGDGIILEIVDIRGGKVRLGIEAPADTSVHREEVWHAIKQNEKRRDEK